MNSFSGKQILVTGAGGFIGSHLVERLVKEGGKVRAFVHYNSRNDWGRLELLPPDVLDEVEIVAGDIQDPFAVQNAVNGTHIVFHLCSLIAIPYSYVAPQSYVTTNVLGAVNVLEAACNETVERVVHTSTSECYGTAQYMPIDEKHPLQGQSPYSASKIGADMIAESYWRSFQLPVAIIRPFNTYGPRQSARAVVPTIITQAIKGDMVRIGSLTPVRDLSYVADIVEAYLGIATAPQAIGKVINVGSGRAISIGDLARLILTMMGSVARIESDPSRVRAALSEVERLQCDNSRARTLLDWEPRIALEEGLKRTIAWIECNQSLYKPDLYNL
jgi:NAD dependent epimerase/dehydratase